MDFNELVVGGHYNINNYGVNNWSSLVRLEVMVGDLFCFREVLLGEKPANHSQIRDDKFYTPQCAMLTMLDVEKHITSK